MKRILIVEDEENISDILSYSLKKEGYETKIAGTGIEALELTSSFRPNLIILDLMLPDMNGLDICKEVTTMYSIPIIMLTAKSDTIDKVLGLELGADDYITKPFNIREVIARVKSIFRRISLLSDNIKTDIELVRLDNGLEINKKEMKVRIDNEIIHLTSKEYELLLYFVDNINTVLTRAQLLDSIWGIDFECESRTVDTHIQRLRKKLGDYNCIQTVIGTGYKLSGNKI
ncbi:response regulator transcription factor [Paeniclostridium sordellii]|uniref:response regulator transcription factor n=1 Tax=Paraclostridium sordellii TaxID=1505 RepID=UPI00214A3071|nr:response regulator transcription factor [Paeniclostridium sordellii]